MNSLNDKTVLCIDYSDSSLKLLEIIFETLSYNVLTAKTASEALQIASYEKFQVCVINLRIADMDSIELVSRFRRLPGLNSSAMIIGITSSQIKTEHQKFLDAGVDQIIPRPFETSDFEKVLSGVKNHTDDESPDAMFVDFDFSTASRDEEVDLKVLSVLAENIGAESTFEAICMFNGELEDRYQWFNVEAMKAPVDEVAQAAHIVKSCASTLGVKQLAEVASDLETACRLSAEEDNVQQLLITLQRKIEKFRNFMRDAKPADLGLAF